MRKRLEIIFSVIFVTFVVGSIANATFEGILLDEVTQAGRVISASHHEIHECDTFRVYRNKDVPNSGTYNIMFTAPNTTKYVHFTFAVDHESEAELAFYETVGSFSGGTAITPNKADGNCSETSGISDMVYDANVSLAGSTTLIHEVGGSGKRFGGAATHDNEWVLKKNTIYGLILTNQGAGANESNFQLDWYEETPAIAQY
jgi:hypothetical protein